FLNATSGGAPIAFLQGLKETGYVEGRNVAIERRGAEGQFDRLPALAADLVSSRVAVIVTGGLPAAQAAKEPKTTIPIVISTAVDPIASGLAASPVTQVLGQLGAERAFDQSLLELLESPSSPVRSSGYN